MIEQSHIVTELKHKNEVCKKLHFIAYDYLKGIFQVARYHNESCLCFFKKNIT